MSGYETQFIRGIVNNARDRERTQLRSTGSVFRQLRDVAVPATILSSGALRVDSVRSRSGNASFESRRSLRARGRKHQRVLRGAR
jgi:hypothetical protein